MFKQDGLTLVETMVATLILAIILMGGQMALLAVQSTWSTTDTQIKLQENLRKTLERVGRELQESGSDATLGMQVTINNGGGTNGSDILRFAIPLCVCSSSPLDAGSNILYWGAPLRWGLTNCPSDILLDNTGKADICHLPPGNPQNAQSLQIAPSALDAHLAHGDWIGPCTPCSTAAHRFIQYSINASNRLVRSVLDDTATVVQTEIFAENITDFQAVFSADQNIVTLTVNALATTNQNRQITVSRTLNVFLRNRG